MITIDDFRKLELKVGQIKAVEDHPNADRLYVVTVDLGEKTKQLVAGIRGSYQKDELLGKLVVVVDNLEPAVLRGVESQGMLLAASDANGIVVVSPEKTIQLGSTVK
ncbi:MAG: methionine--tRNA ligase subunit beta [Candidatus Omnitrophica bacterium]|nr:methionine--tRNA ligase subunit beta [Candidatus Omnitrophota bacterium]